jgi:branched-chain amino acid transport system permease protein
MLDLASYVVFFLVTALGFTLICLGLNLQWGFTGLFNAGVAGFVAVGAYVSAILTTPASAQHLGGFGLPIAAGWLGGAMAAAATAALVGIATLRLRRDYLAIATFGIAASLLAVAQNAHDITGGPFGITFIPRPFATLSDRPALYDTVYLALMAALVGIVFLGLETLLHGPWGRALKAIREDELAAAALGKDPRRFRLEAFVIGSGIMGLAGAVEAHFVGFIAPDEYLPILTFQAWTMLIIGGSGNNRGAVLGSLVVWTLWSVSGTATHTLLPGDLQVRGAALQIVLIGVLLAAMLVLRPRGLIGERTIVSRHIMAAGSPGGSGPTSAGEAP